MKKQWNTIYWFLHLTILLKPHFPTDRIQSWTPVSRIMLHNNGHWMTYWGAANNAPPRTKRNVHSATSPFLLGYYWRETSGGFSREWKSSSWPRSYEADGADLREWRNIRRSPSVHPKCLSFSLFCFLSLLFHLRIPILSLAASIYPQVIAFPRTGLALKYHSHSSLIQIYAKKLIETISMYY